MIDDYCLRIHAKIGTERQMSYTDIMDWSSDEFPELNERKIRYKIQILEKNRWVKKISVKKGGHEVYQIATADDDLSSHTLYLLGTKSESFYHQDDVSSIIKLNENRIKKAIKEKTEDFPSLVITSILSALFWHKKISFAVSSGWFGHSKTEQYKAEKNRKRIDNFILTTMTHLRKTDYESWHSVLHAIHDVIDGDRVYSKKQLQRIWKF